MLRVRNRQAMEKFVDGDQISGPAPHSVHCPPLWQCSPLSSKEYTSVRSNLVTRVNLSIQLKLGPDLPSRLGRWSHVIVVTSVKSLVSNHSLTLSLLQPDGDSMGSLVPESACTLIECRDSSTVNIGITIDEARTILSHTFGFICLRPGTHSITSDPLL